MATKLRRLNISLPPELDEALVRFSRLSGQHQSTFVVTCLMENIEALNLLSDSIEALQAGNIGEYEKLVAQSLGTVLLKAGKTSLDKED